MVERCQDLGLFGDVIGWKSVASAPLTPHFPFHLSPFFS